MEVWRSAIHESEQIGEGLKVVSYERRKRDEDA